MGNPEKVSARRSTIDDWTAELAKSSGSPGGGAASGVMLAIAYALTSMVAGYTDGDPEVAEIRRRALEGRETALRLADHDASASDSFGSAFTLPAGEQREDAIREASVDAARSSAALGKQSAEAVADLEWLAQHGNPALIADVAVACGALRAAVSGARANVSFDLTSLTSSGDTLAQVREQHPMLWEAVPQFDDVIGRIDRLSAQIDGREALSGGGG